MKHFSSLFSFARKRAALITVAAVALGGASVAAQAQPSRHHEQQVCAKCGTVVSVHTYEKAAERGTGLGVATGAVVGGLLGNHVGGGNGRTLATVAGAVGGGYAGNQIEKNVRSTTVTDVRVRMSNGTLRTFTEAGRSQRFKGERVRVADGRLLSNR
ncbi:glycine zipper 2TM domain-containing protein [Massilia horti]|uniref:Glycine zipper 2TM domain-containing protein n=1 Tax=Massilia horti TaxID=2562153 RepID=A0A4Y9T7N1_9BURK|nr:glycine zipper 2TM domain-containing protein [Massilia horti]TFW34388.1 glycine zipper 2TM domain-containing protein [Massilia horti]